MAYTFGAVSRSRRAGVHPKLLRVVDRALEIAYTLGQDFSINEGVRTLDRQKWLYASGRTRKGPIVTKTLKSKHIKQADGFAHAIDLLPFPFKSWEDVRGFELVKRAMLEAAAQLKTPLRTFSWDSPHFELA